MADLISSEAVGGRFHQNPFGFHPAKQDFIIAFLSDLCYSYSRGDIMPQNYFLGKIVKVIVDRPLGSVHPKHKDLIYNVNYGYIPEVIAPDGEEQDAYVLGLSEPVAEFVGKVIAIVHRLNDIEDKWIVAPENKSFSKEEIADLVAFQEKFFDTEIVT